VLEVLKVLVEGDEDRSCRVNGLGYVKEDQRLVLSFQTLIPSEHQGHVDVYRISRRSQQ